MYSKALAEIEAISREMRFLRWLNPTATSVEREKEIFFARGTDYEPSFDYETPYNFRDMSGRIADVTAPEGDCEELYEAKLLELAEQNELLRYRGDKERTMSRSRKIFGSVSFSTVNSAERLLKDPIEIQTTGRMLGPDEIRQTFVERIAYYGIDWAVEFTDSPVSFVNVASRQVFIPKRERDEATVNRLLVHEVDTHVLRAANGYAQTGALQILGTGLAEYAETEEGLATWMEERAGLQSPALLREYAARALAVDLLSRENLFLVPS